MLGDPPPPHYFSPPPPSFRSRSLLSQIESGALRSDSHANTPQTAENLNPVGTVPTYRGAPPESLSSYKAARNGKSREVLLNNQKHRWRHFSEGVEDGFGGSGVGELDGYGKYSSSLRVPTHKKKVARLSGSLCKQGEIVWDEGGRRVEREGGTDIELCHLPDVALVLREP